MENLTKKYRLFKACRDFSFIQVSNYRGSSMQVRAEGCSITVLIGGADMNVQDSIQEGDEVTVVIKGQMTDNGWNAISVTDQVSHS